MIDTHPITPSPELVQQWRDLPEYTDGQQKVIMITLSREKFLDIATQAARWGADQELKACCNYMQKTYFHGFAKELRAVRRPKPPSLAEQATAELDEAVMRGDCITTTDAMPILRAALKRLKKLEQSND